MTEDKDPSLPTQSPEDAALRMAGVPKTAEELEAERVAVEEARKSQLAAAAGENQPQPGPTPPPEPQTEPAPEPEPRL